MLQAYADVHETVYRYPYENNSSREVGVLYTKRLSADHVESLNTEGSM